MNKDLLIDELIVKVNKLEEENKTLKTDMNNIKERLNLFEKYFAEEIKYKKFIEDLGLDTKIIDKKEDLQFIYNRLVNNDENLKQKKIKYNLLYRATRDGDSSTSFHNRVDNKKSLLSITFLYKVKFTSCTFPPGKSTLMIKSTSFSLLYFISAFLFSKICTMVSKASLISSHILKPRLSCTKASKEKMFE